MIDDPTDTLTTIEAKVLCMRYGINNIDESNSVNTLRNHTANDLSHSKSVNDIAKKLGKDCNTVKKTEMNALRKLNITG